MRPRVALAMLYNKYSYNKLFNTVKILYTNKAENVNNGTKTQVIVLEV